MLSISAILSLSVSISLSLSLSVCLSASGWARGASALLRGDCVPERVSQ